MNTAFPRHLAIAGTYNIRDLGGYRTPIGETRWRQVFRADALHRLDPVGIEAVLAAGITTVIDLRHGHELDEQPNPLSSIPEIDYRNVPIFADLAPGLSTGENALFALYRKALDERGALIAKVVTLIGNAREGAVMFHCTAGKDRTGIIAALLLGLAGVDADQIAHDYSLTASHIEPMLAELIAGAMARGIAQDQFMPFLSAEPQTMMSTLTHIQARYGSVSAYLGEIGVSGSTIGNLKTRMLGEL